MGFFWFQTVWGESWADRGGRNTRHVFRKDCWIYDHKEFPGAVVSLTSSNIRELEVGNVDTLGEWPEHHPVIYHIDRWSITYNGGKGGAYLSPRRQPRIRTTTQLLAFPLIPYLSYSVYISVCDEQNNNEWKEKKKEQKCEKDFLIHQIFNRKNQNTKFWVKNRKGCWRFWKYSKYCVKIESVILKMPNFAE